MRTAPHRITNCRSSIKHAFLPKTVKILKIVLNWLRYIFSECSKFTQMRIYVSINLFENEALTFVILDSVIFKCIWFFSSFLFNTYSFLQFSVPYPAFITHTSCLLHLASPFVDDQCLTKCKYFQVFLDIYWLCCLPTKSYLNQQNEYSLFILWLRTTFIPLLTLYLTYLDILAAPTYFA